MSIDRAASRYAEALLATVAEGEETERYRAGMERLSDALAAHAPLRHALLNPRVDAAAKLEVLSHVAGEPLTQMIAMFRLFLAKGRAGEVEAVADAFCRAADARANVVRARVEAAVELSEGELVTIRRRVSQESGKTVHLEEHTNPSLLGGFRVVFADQIWDQSLSWQLTRLRQRLEEKTPA